jgi:hypothetical protein
MELLLIIAMVLAAIVLFDVLAISLGADSRESIGDDWGRPIRL